MRSISKIGLVYVCLVLPLFLMPYPQAFAVEPNEVLKDPNLEARARKLSLELRCLVCQNQSIDDSNAPLAKDLRVLVRERLTAGDTDTQVLDYIVARYGEFVLLRPRLGVHTLLLWFAPPLILLLAAFVIYRSWGRRLPAETPHTATASSLTAEEQDKLKELLDER